MNSVCTQLLKVLPLLATGGGWFCTPPLAFGEPDRKSLPLSAKAVRQLSRKTASAALPVQIEGVVTWRAGGDFHGLLVHDGTEAVYVDVRQAEMRGVVDRTQTELWGADLKQGFKARVTGVTDSGGYAPCVIPREITVTGEGVMPAAESTFLTHLASGALEGQRVMLDGVVREIKPGADTAGRVLIVGRGEGEFPVVVVNASALDCESLVDAHIRVTGVSLPLFNSRAEIAIPSVQANDANDITVIKPALSADAFLARLVPINELRTFQRRHLILNRCRVRGVVTAHGSKCLFIQEGRHGLKIEGKFPELTPGDLVEASGFVSLGGPVSSLVHAVVRKTGTGEMPPPLATDVRTLITGAGQDAVRGSGTRADLNHTVVSVVGELVHVEHLQDEMRLTLLNSGSYSRAFLAGCKPEALPANFHPGCTARFTGVVSLDYDDTYRSSDGLRASSARFDLRTADDIVVLKAVPWWTPWRGGKTLAASFTIVAALLGWALLQRRVVARQVGEMYLQKRQIRDEALRLEAVHRERNRLGGEIHDGVQQIMHTLRLESENARKCLPALPLAAAFHTENVRRGIDHALQEMRRCLLGLSQVTADHVSLEQLLEKSMEVFSPQQRDCVEITRSGAARTVPGHVRASLCLIAQEAVGNALRHGRATRISLSVGWEDGLRLCINDNGQGFDTARPVEEEPLHFGLTGMMARMRRLGGDLSIESAPGQGTCICATLSTASLDFESRHLTTTSP